MTLEAAFWNKHALKYSRQPVADESAFERKKEITRSALRPDSVIADIGCGTGSLALELAPLVSEVHAVDVSSSMLSIAKAKAETLGVNNLRFHQSSVQSLETLPCFAPESLDVVCAYSILHLVPGRSALYQSLLRALKPGGYLISSSVCLGDSWIPFRPLLAVMRWIGKAPYVDILTSADLVDEQRQAGFSEVAVRDVGAKEAVAFIVARKARA